MANGKRRKAPPRLVMWGFHDAHGGVVLKLSDYSRAEYRRRTAEGWTCAAYAVGDNPSGLLALADAKKRAVSK